MDNVVLNDTKYIMLHLELSLPSFITILIQNI